MFDLTIALEKMDCLQSSVKLFTEQLKDIRYVVPNLHVLLQGPIPASSLKLVKLNEWPQDATLSLSKAGHFVAVDLHNFNDFPLDKGTFISRYREVVEKIDAPFAEMVRVEALTCVREMCKNLMRLHGHTANEAEVRFAFANPIVNMLCAVHGLFLGLEQKMTAPVDTGSSSSDQVTEKSSSDYFCYTLHQQSEDSHIKLAAVIVEAKTNASYSSNAIAQLLGYYLRSCTKEDEHTVGLLLTETKVHLVLFPFVFAKSSVTCVNAIWLNSIEYSDKNTWNTISMLTMLAVVTRRDFYHKSNLENRLCPIGKDHHFMIKSEMDIIKDELQKKLTEVEEERAKVEAERRAMKAEKEEMAALMSKCKSFKIAVNKLSTEEIDSINTSFKKLKL